MPCILCNRSVTIIPCKHINGILTIEEFVSISKLNPNPSLSLLTYTNAYKNLHDDCPCKDCLIKPMCCEDNKATDLCDAYKIKVGG